MSGAATARRPSRRVLALVLAALVLLGAGWWWTHRLEPVATYERPDHRYKVVVLRRAPWRPGMPGPSGDAPGVVRLLDRSDRILEESPVEMVQDRRGRGLGRSPRRDQARRRLVPARLIRRPARRPR